MIFLNFFSENGNILSLIMKGKSSEIHFSVGAKYDWVVSRKLCFKHWVSLFVCMQVGCVSVYLRAIGMLLNPVKLGLLYF